MRWKTYASGVVLGALVLGLWTVPLSALPPGAEQVATVRRALTALQEDLRALVLEHFEALAHNHQELEDQLELLAEAVQDLIDQGGVYRPDEVRVLLNQAEEILEAFLFHLEQALEMLDEIEDRLAELQNQLGELKNDQLLSGRGHQRATRALELAQQILTGKLRPPLNDLQSLSDDSSAELCVVGPFGEPNPATDLQDCFADAGASLTNRDYETMLDQVEAAHAKLEPMLSRLVQIFLGTNLRRGPVSELLIQLKNIDRQLVAALKRLLRRPRVAAELSLPTAVPYSAPSPTVQLLVFDLQGRLIHRADAPALSPLTASLNKSLANGVYLIILTQQTPDGRLQRQRRWLVVRR